MVLTHIKENSKNIWTYAHIPMYTGLRSIYAYICEKGIKSHVQQIMSVFRNDLGNIERYKNTPWGPKSLQRDREGHIYVIYHV